MVRAADPPSLEPEQQPGCGVPGAPSPGYLWSAQRLHQPFQRAAFKSSVLPTSPKNSHRDHLSCGF